MFRAGPFVPGLLFIVACARAGAAADPGLAACAAIGPDSERLACYDRVAGRDIAPVAEPEARTALPSPEYREATSWLADRWELGRMYARGALSVRPHRGNYLIAAYSSSPNEAPFLPFRSVAPGVADLSPAELAFQLSFKLKFADNPLGAPVDLWFAYTQRSFWQAFSSEASSPFRATDYQPELMAVFPTRFNLLGLQMRFINLGLVHESNGQAGSLSRSWNRAYAQFGFERGNFSLLLRRWVRFEEEPQTDDNADIIAYMGRGDVVARYRWDDHEFALLARLNTDSGRGAAQIGWAFPLTDALPRLRGYVQLFSGYGYSLIDYNHAQTVLGVGVMLGD